MFTRGEFTSNNVTYGVIMNYTKACIEAILVTSGTVVSAYKTDATGSYSYNNVRAKELVQLIKNGVKGCTSKNGTPMPFELGAMTQHEFAKTKVEYIMQMHKGEVVGAYIQSGDKRVELTYNDQCEIPANIPYIKLTEVQVKKELDVAEDDLDAVPVRSVQEIALEKDDLTWLQNKKYYIVNDDETAEKLFTFLDNYNGAIAYDTETTGLRINCFGKINSEYSKSLQKYNKEHPDEQIRSDRLVGIIFCVENDTSYYFPCFNRKFKNLYEDIDSPIRNRIINNIKTRYTIGDRRDSDGDMRDYVLNTPADQFRLDVILMERVRDILHTKHIVAHNGTFEWKVGWQYEIDTNLTDDTMIMHQLMYKFRSTTSNRGEPSNLKYLAKRELGIDQWELSDFFPDWKADSTGTVRTKAGAKAKKSGSRIDFSYMDYEGTRVYAPTDGDVTFLLYNLYKKDMKKNHADMEYIYSVEIIVSCAIAYMEFYGHRLDESKILGAREQTRANIAMIVSEIRQLISYSNNDEVIAYNNLKQLRKDIDAAKGDEKAALEAKLPDMVNSLNSAIDANTDKVINLASPAQVCDLFYNKMKIPVPGDKQSVAKKEIKALLKEKDENGKDKYPIVHMYSKYKNEDTLMTKFFDNLPYFMYPGGYIFSSFGQISTATGRMSCSRPNAQQYPKVITKIVSPRPGFVMMDADYSQIEYRVLTALAKNTELAKLFSHPDSDYHTLMASLMYSVPYASVTPQMRSAAKSFNFGIPYGMGIKSLSILLNGKSDKKSCDEAMEKYELYFKNQPRTRKFFDDIKEMAQVNGYTKTLFNRYRYYSFTDKDGNVNNGKRAAALRQAGNAVIQGCLDGDTRIQTKELGIVKIKDAVNTHLHVWDGKEWADGDVLYSGKKQKCIITFSNGQKFVCSPIHKFLVRSAKGNDRFVECKDLATKQNSKNPHRIVVNPEYVKSDYTYSSEWAYKYDVNNNNAHNTHLDHIYDSFDAGVLLGRLASDGTISKREQGASFILNYIAEHEMNIAPELRRCMEMLGDVKESNYHRPDRNEDMHRMYIYSASLVGEVQELDVKHKMHDFIFNDTEMLRGFLRGMFDGDGGVSGKTIALTFGTQYDFTNMCDDIQKALLFFGIRSRTYKFEDRYKVTIKTNDNGRFMELIGFINEDKNEAANSLECVRDEHLFGRILIPESVEITDEYIDMYDVCNTTNGYYVADGIVTHNTAADIFKIGVARNFSFIRRNNLFGKMLIINMIHDEQLMEVDVQHLNMQRILAEVGKNMQFHIDGFPPLYIGAGIGPAWGYAKGKMAEIHPLLLEQFTKEAESIPIYREDCSTPVDTKEVLDYFQNRVYEFRRKKVADYLADPANWHQDIHPAIGGLINLQFNYGRGDDAKAYVGPNGEKYNDTEFLMLNIADFLKENNIDAKLEYFTAQEQQKEVEEDNSYDDSDEEEPNVDDMVDDSAEPQIFSKIDESNKLFGASLHDYIGIFGTCILEKSRVCGIDTRNLHFRKRDAIIAYLMNYICDEDDPDGNQIVFLTDGNILKYTGIYVKGLKASELEANYKIFLNNSKAVKGDDSDYQNGDIDNRSQAK